MPIVEATPNSDDSKPSRPDLSEDGKGGTVPAPNLKAEVCSIYYRLYTKVGPLESRNPIYFDDRCIGRISPRSVRPPHTAASLKKHLCKIEGFGATNGCTLYPSLSEQTALEDSTQLSFRGTSGPGLSNLNPVALVFDTRAVDKRSQTPTTVDATKLLERDYEQRYVYYLVYNDDGEVLSKTSFSEDSPFLGRVNTLSIPTPHTASSLKRHLIKSEEILGYNVQLFEDEGGESIMDDSDTIALFAGTFPGFVEYQPMVITYESQGLGINTNPADNEDPNEVPAQEPPEPHSAFEALQKSNETHTRELAQVMEGLEKMDKTLSREIQEAISALGRLKEDVKQLNKASAFKEGASPAQLQALFERPSLTMKYKATGDYVTNDPTWHSMKKGDIFYTDGTTKKKAWSGYSYEYVGFLAIDSSGKLVLVYQSYVTLC